MSQVLLTWFVRGGEAAQLAAGAVAGAVIFALVQSYRWVCRS